MSQSNGVLQMSAVTALETASEDSLSLAGESFSLMMPYTRATVALSRPA